MQFKNADEVKTYVNDELNRALPAGWVARFRLQYRCLDKPAKAVSLGDMEWKIARANETLPSNDYLLRVSSDLSTLFIVYGNSDAGAPGRLEHDVLNAKVIYVRDLPMFPLSEIIAHVISHCTPNTWGLT